MSPRPQRRQPPPLHELERQVEEWNSRHQIGTRIVVRRDNGTTMFSTTRSEASILSGHSAVIWVDGISGCYALDRVWPAPADPDPRQGSEDAQPADAQGAA